jgi:hypothetical protein
MCENHRQRSRRHGAPTQARITKKDVRPYVRRARQIIERDTSGRIEAALREIHTILKDHTGSVVMDAERGRWVSKWEARSARETLNVLSDTDPVECGLTVGAMFLLRLHDPRLFKTDRGFVFQLVRQFRALTDLSYGSFYNYRTGKTKKTYRDLPAQAVHRMGRLVIEAYARFGGHLLQAERSECERRHAVRSGLDEGFAAIGDGG